MISRRPSPSVLWLVTLSLGACGSGPGGGSDSGGGGNDSGTGASANNGSGASGSGSGASNGTGSTGNSSCKPQFSDELEAYPVHPTASSKSAEQIAADTEAEDEARLSSEERAKRLEVIEMYRKAGFDISLDQGTLQNIRPKTWSMETPEPLSGEYLAPYSIDASFYHAIPCDTARVELPTGYFDSVQLNANGFDNLHYGVAVSGASDPVRQVTADCCNEGTSQSMHVRDDVYELFGHNGDFAVSLIDSTDNSIAHAFYFWPEGEWTAARVTARQILPNLGDVEGTIAAGFSDMALLIRKGEATSPDKPIAHAIAIGGNRLWNAKVYPAQTVDSFVSEGAYQEKYSLDGLVPYGGVVQLDPGLDLSTLELSLPARRILEAVQTYGAYLMNTTDPAFNIYTNTDASEFGPFGGVYNPTDNNGVQDQIKKVLATAKVFVVPPIVKR